MAATYVSTVLLNPDSGPGSSQLQLFTDITQQSQAAGMKVLGYVDSAYGDRALEDVLNDIDTYSQWYQVDGFFIDDMYIAGKQMYSLTDCSECCCCWPAHVSRPADETKVQYYQEIYNGVKNSSLYSDESVDDTQLIFNPGAPEVPEAYMPFADIFLTFEGSAASYTNFQAADYTDDYDASKFWHVVYSCDSNATINATLEQFTNQRAEYLYITDLGLPNPYGNLPSIETWAQLLAYMGDIVSSTS